MIAVIYARYSSENQRSESIDAQIRACREYCLSKGYTIANIYVDEAKSALSDDRPTFQRMIRDAKTKAFNVIVVHKRDRIFRNRYDAVHYKRELSKVKVTIESVVERLDNSPESIMMESVLDGMAEYYSANLARETMKGLKENALQCKSCGGKPPLGYDLDQDGHYVINPSEQHIVKLIFTMYGQGKTYKEILAALKPYKTKNGNSFGRNSLHDILRNEKYAGIFVYNKRDCSKSGYSSRDFKSQDEWIRIENGIPAIVPLDLFESVQQLMDKRRLMPEIARQRSKVTYMLSGLIECGVCGLHYVGNSSIRAKSKYRYSVYECSSRKKLEHCGNIRVSKNLLEKEVVAGIQEIISNRKEQIVSDILNAVRKLQNRDNDEVELIKDRIKQLEIAINNLVQAVEKGLATNTLLQQLDQKEKELELAKRNLEDLIEENKLPSWTRGQIEAYLTHISTAMEQAADQPRVKLLVQKLVEKVIVYQDRAEIIYKIEGLGPGPGTNGRKPSTSTTTDAVGGPNPRVTASVALECRKLPSLVSIDIQFSKNGM